MLATATLTPQGHLPSVASAHPDKEAQMNIDRVREIADDLERADPDAPDFSMMDFFGAPLCWRAPAKGEIRWCGTAACIAGQISVTKMPIRNPLRVDHHRRARRWLGISYGLSENLFVAWNAKISLGSITRAEAVVCLRHLADTFEKTGEGEVDWDRAHRIAKEA